MSACCNTESMRFHNVIYGIDFSRSTKFLTQLSFQQTNPSNNIDQSKSFCKSIRFCSSCDGDLLKLNETIVDSPVYDDGLLEPTHTPLLKVRKCEIFDRSDFPDFYTIKSSWVGDLVIKILAYYLNFSGS